MLTVNLLTSKSEFAKIESDWNRLSHGIPFRSWQWCTTWWDHYGQDHELCIVTIKDADRCIGIAPLFIANQEPLGRILRIMGDGEVCADYLSILSLSTDAKRVGEALSDWFSQDHAMPPWDLMELDGLDGECPTLRAFLQSIEQRGFGVRLSSKVNTWRLPLSGADHAYSMDDYLLSLSKPNRRKIRTALKRFDAQECRVTIASDQHEFTEIWDQLIELHQRRRNSLGDPGCFASCTFSDFLRDAARAFFADGALDLVRVSVGDWPVSTELCFRGSATTFAYQLGIDPDALRENPGWLVNTASIRHALNTGQTSFDWCRGDEEYKRRLGAKPKPCLECRVIPPKFRSQLWNAALIGQSTVKEWLKTGLNVTGIRS